MENEDALAQAGRDVRECEERIANQVRLVERLEARRRWEAADHAPSDFSGPPGGAGDCPDPSESGTSGARFAVG